MALSNMNQVTVRNFTGTQCVSCSKKIGSAYNGTNPGRKNLHVVAVTLVSRVTRNEGRPSSVHTDIKGFACASCATKLNHVKSDLESPYNDHYNPAPGNLLPAF